MPHGTSEAIDQYYPTSFACLSSLEKEMSSYVSEYAQQKANLEWSRGVPENQRQDDLAILRRYHLEAQQGKPWPPASPYLTASLDAQIPGLKQYRDRRDALRSANQTPRDLSSDDQVLELAENWKQEIQPFQT